MNYSAAGVLGALGVVDLGALVLGAPVLGPLGPELL